jgi:Ca2+-binding RTX toxin-like protein
MNWSGKNQPVIEKLENRQMLAAGPWSTHGGKLFIRGTDGDDKIVLKAHEEDPKLLIVKINGETDTVQRKAVRCVKINLGAGDDFASIDGLDFRSHVYGDDGDDTVIGGTARDKILGGDGNDSLDGGNGRDMLQGGQGDDILAGGAAEDILIGNTGSDNMDGGTECDRLMGGSGADSLCGGDGKDDMTCGNGNDKWTGHDADEEKELDRNSKRPW